MCMDSGGIDPQMTQMELESNRQSAHICVICGYKERPAARLAKRFAKPNLF
ncbi:MAG: hypothetical protein HN707_01110, partial [Verrucomicrobia bacterium]|nr:hypothetical protein [Verrucomicrobiota bacterium]